MAISASAERALTNSFGLDVATEVGGILAAVQALSGPEAAFLDGVVAGTGAPSKALVLDSDSAVTLPAGAAIKATGDGFNVGSAAADKVGFYGASPVAQPADADQDALGAMTTVGANTGTAGAGLSLIGDTSQGDESGNIMNDFAALREDIDALATLVNSIRDALVDVGLIKGDA